jgi:ABC-type Fe3+/spermidine/putrescine transport system ATPase subunit
MIEIRLLNLEFTNFSLQDIDLKIGAKDYFMLVGPTGAGKTLLLETIAGLHKVKSGEIWINNENITELEPEKRNFSMVYQDCALFPHISVAENIMYGLKLRHLSGGTIAKELDEMASLFDIGPLLNRKPGKLSGGEKQKVALARALIIKPRLLLLDEPLSSLDPETREGMQKELKRIHSNLGITVIHVTHDFEEALLLGKHLAVIGKGSVRQTGTPEEIFRHPNSEFVARFTMMRNILPGELVCESENTNIFRSGNLELFTAAQKETVSHACIRPDDIEISVDISPVHSPNTFIGFVSGIEDRGMSFHIIVNLPQEVCCVIPRSKFREMGLALGQTVKITFSPESVHVF